jgi:hypothetical protein
MEVVEQFFMEVDFDGATGYECACGEYRQFVRGTLELNGRSVNHLLPNPAGGDPIPLLPRPVDGATADNFLEDGSLDDGNPQYGHRDCTDPGNNDETDRYLDERDTGCQYRGSDAPGIEGGSPGETYLVDLHFRGQAIDVCNGSQVLRANEWTVTCHGTFPTEETT